ncbi:hypothetical protein DYL59_24255 [Pseudomonas kairouanensis]|uniref:Uncharacterized protein n=1 Tax=Pseudomonas kairouanensis TaxID=2293832 RepID=A0A4Z0AHA8_9PSED|nr:hypothetical protein DYL59_24255 [Pseudomonas kairouanensis]
METVTMWGYNLKVSDLIALGALVVAGLALLLSGLAYRLNRNSLSLYEGGDQRGIVLYVTNNSPHAVTITDIGFVGPDGHRSTLLGEHSLRVRIDPRDEASIPISTSQAFRLQCAKGDFSRHCLFVALATGDKFYTVGRFNRWWWWLLGWRDGSRRRRIQRSE